jgi:hypothetical protein
MVMETSVGKAKAGYYTAKYAANREYSIAKTREWQQRNPIKYQITQYKSRSKRMGIEYLLDNEQASDLLTDNCYYCGQSPSPVNGIDRSDNDRGYITGNVVTACRMCNTAKNNHSLDEFLLWIKRLQLTGEKHADC